MKPSEYLDAAKERLCLSSDYALAKTMEVPREHIPGFRTGKRGIPPHLALRLAITLELDPAAVLFDLEEQREKNDKRRELYRSFLLRARSLAALVACTLALILSAGVSSDLAAVGGFKPRRKFA